jgi:hypothetical protein
VSAGCAHVDRVRGPDGSDNWLAVSCTGSRTHCYQAAANECPSGYIVADSASGSTVAGSVTNGTGYVSSVEHGDLLIKCKASSGDDATAAVAREEAQESAVAAERDRSQCRTASKHLDELSPLWAEWFQGQPVEALPERSVFVRACMALDDDSQFCLSATYARGHKDACLARIQGLPRSKRAELNRLLLRAPDTE